MSDDAALLLRVAVFGLVAGAVYWFLSYEPLGTVALLVLGVGPGFAALFLLRHRRQPGAQRESRRDMLRRLAGAPPGDPPGPKTLEDDDLAVLPSSTLWPFAASLGLAIAGSGLVFGLWLVIVGLAIALYSAWGWVAAIMREARYGHAEPAEEPTPEPGRTPDGAEQPLRRR
jgi:Cytochrome c oxidase subunit IV